MAAVEPMLMGSPVPSSPSAHHIQSPYLPAYLMGEATPAAASPGSRLWSGASGSPPKASHYGKSLTSPSQGQFIPQSFTHTPRQRDVLPGRTKEKAGAPPVQGLLETITSPTDRTKVEFGTPAANTSQFHTPGVMAHTSGYGTPGLMNTTSAHDSSHMFNQSINRKTSPSPAQIDPFYTQGENITSEEILDETWVTVFGFPPAATSFILQQFSQYGNILKHVVASDGNWMHIHYQSKLQAKKALSKNSKVFGNSIMVGVTPCIDKEVMTAHSQLDTSLAQRPGTSLGTPLNQSVLTERTLNTSQRNTPIRPLTAAYKAASSDHQVVQAGSTPQKNSGVVTKAMEYMFGW